MQLSGRRCHLYISCQPVCTDKDSTLLYHQHLIDTDLTDMACDCESRPGVCQVEVLHTPCARCRAGALQRPPCVCSVSFLQHLTTQRL